MKQWGDELGLFWEAPTPVAPRKGKQERAPLVRPPVPETGWKRPEYFPDLSTARDIAVDVETHDPYLTEKGSGFKRGDAHIVGVAVGTDDGYRAYFPFDHDQSDNFRKEDVYPWLSQQLTRTKQRKVGANLYYDIEALQHEGVKIEGPLRDVQVAEPLLDELKYEYNLESLSQEYLGIGKEESEMIIWGMRAFGCKESEVKRHMKEIPAKLVGPYAEGDVDRPLRILPLQEAKLASENLTELFELESRLMWPLLRMRQNGVRIDVERVAQVHEQFQKRFDNIVQELGNINTDESAALVRLFDKNGIDYPRTAKGNPSFTKIWLEHHPHPICQKLVEARKYRTLLSTFVKGYMEDHCVGGRIYAQFNQLKGDKYGTITGRLSSSNPNLQNIPIRDEEIGPLIRSIFIPEEGQDWGKLDWSQIEYRLIVHFASVNGCEGAQSAVRRYAQDKTTDFHQLVAELCKISRKQAKNINFGIAYGQGVALLAASLGCSLEEARVILTQYHRDAPFISELMDDYARDANNKGYITTLLKRRRRYKMFEKRGVRVSTNYNQNAEYRMLPHAAAVAEWGEANIQRAKTYAAMNAGMQGSAADIMKKAMVDIYEEGLFDVLKFHLTVHDELDKSVPRTKIGKEAFDRTRWIMENCVKLRVPLYADGGIGKNWSDIK